jgi:hypothetical protein
MLHILLTIPKRKKENKFYVNQTYIFSLLKRREVQGTSLTVMVVLRAFRATTELHYWGDYTKERSAKRNTKNERMSAAGITNSWTSTGNMEGLTGQRVSESLQEIDRFAAFDWEARYTLIWLANIGLITKHVSTLCGQNKNFSALMCVCVLHMCVCVLHMSTALL